MKHFGVLERFIYEGGINVADKYAGLTYEQVVNKFFQTIASVCVLHIKNYADAQDCFQNTFVKLFEKSPTFNDEEHLKAWLIRVAINECNNLYRKNKRLVSFDDYKKEKSIKYISDDEKDISWALIQLDEKYRDVLYLRYCENYNANEIAKILSKNPATVRTMLKRGKEMLKRIYGGDDDE